MKTESSVFFDIPGKLYRMRLNSNNKLQLGDYHGMFTFETEIAVVVYAYQLRAITRKSYVKTSRFIDFSSILYVVTSICIIVSSITKAVHGYLHDPC